jgi:hypothetical protein
MRNFPKIVRRAAYSRADGQCEQCGAVLLPGCFHYDHIVAWALSRSSTADNCQVLCSSCHGDKTARRDVPAIAKVVRIRDRMMATRGVRKLLPAGRRSGLRKTLAGPVVPRITQAEAHREFIARRYGNFEE